MTFFIEISSPPLWPGYFSAQFARTHRFRRVWFLWFALAWIDLDLQEYGRHIASGTTEWRKK